MKRESKRSFVVMRTDDNGNDFEVTRVATRSEAEALTRELETRGHKQLYWIVDESSVPSSDSGA